MDAVVPPEITAELRQILSNLVLGDNEIRSNAENIVNKRLQQTPDLYLLALAQFAITADTDVMRSFSLVLLRRLLFRTAGIQRPKAPRLTLYDHLSSSTLTTLERLLLHSLTHEPKISVRRKTVDTVTDLANNSMKRGRPWHALQATVFHMIQSNDDEGAREVAFRVFQGSPMLVMDLQTDVVIGVFQTGLQDASLEVRLASLRASVSYLSSADTTQTSQSLSLIPPMLSTLSLPATQVSYFPKFINTITPLAYSHPNLFAPHLPALLTFLPSLILPSVDSGPTPTAHRPFPTSSTSRDFVFPPSSSALDDSELSIDDEEQSDIRQSALEFMITISESRPSIVRNLAGWSSSVIRGCLEGMGEIPDDNESLQEWLDADPSDDITDPTQVYSEALDRLSMALGGKSVLPPAFQYIPSMLSSYDWRLRHAGLMAVASIAEGSSKIMQQELGKIVELVTPMFQDANPRVRYAACQCVGQLCTDLEEVIQEHYHQQLFSVLIPALEAPEARVHCHAAAALINFCEGVSRTTLLPYLDAIVERLLKLLNASSSETLKSGQASIKCYVQEQVITTLAMVADASETTFERHYSSIMPLLLNVLQNAQGTGYRKLRVKAMECAGLIAIAVGRDVFRPDSSTFIDLLMKIQNSPIDPGDTLLGYYLIATWAKICQAMGQEFEPYLPAVMPPLLQAASAKADISLYEDEPGSEREGWETVHVDGQTLGIRTSAIEEKCQAFETLVIYASTLKGQFAPYLSQTLEIALPSLQFYFHDGVREACALLVPILLSCGKASNALTPRMASATIAQIIDSINKETDTSFLASLYKCLADCLRVLGGSQILQGELLSDLIDATKRQLQDFADKRKQRTQRPQDELESDIEDVALLEEMEDFALEDMRQLLEYLDANHPLLVAVSSVRDLGYSNYEDNQDES